VIERVRGSDKAGQRERRCDGEKPAQHGGKCEEEYEVEKGQNRKNEE
jgi:hypothetical protein